MRNENALFWREAAKSLPSHVRSRYAGYFEAAEAWEIAFDRIGSFGARLKDLFARTRAQAA
jgi:hypothetical protein